MIPTINLRAIQEALPPGFLFELQFFGKGTPGIPDTQIVLTVGGPRENARRLTTFLAIENRETEAVLSHIRAALQELDYDG